LAYRLFGEQVCAVPIAGLSPVELALVPLNGGNIVRPALTLAQAFADELNAVHGRFGRRACVYAIDPDGLTHFVDPALRPAP
jgi:hypothetical protein